MSAKGKPRKITCVESEDADVEKQSTGNAPVSALAFFLPLASPKVLAQVRERLGLDDEKLTLLIVRALNPLEVLTNEEEGVLRGVTAKTVGAMKGRGELPQVP